MPCSRSLLVVVSQHALQVSRPTPRREVEGDLARGGVSRPRTNAEVKGIWPGGGGVSRHPRILLECILVYICLFISVPIPMFMSI